MSTRRAEPIDASQPPTTRFAHVLMLGREKRIVNDINTWPTQIGQPGQQAQFMYGNAQKPRPDGFDSVAAYQAVKDAEDLEAKMGVFFNHPTQANMWLSIEYLIYSMTERAEGSNDYVLALRDSWVYARDLKFLNNFIISQPDGTFDEMKGPVIRFVHATADEANLKKVETDRLRDGLRRFASHGEGDLAMMAADLMARF